LRLGIPESFGSHSRGRIEEKMEEKKKTKRSRQNKPGKRGGISLTNALKGELAIGEKKEIKKLYEEEECWKRKGRIGAKSKETSRVDLWDR